MTVGFGHVYLTSTKISEQQRVGGAGKRLKIHRSKLTARNSGVEPAEETGQKTGLWSKVSFTRVEGHLGVVNLFALTNV